MTTYIYIYWCFYVTFLSSFFRGLLTFEEKNSNSHLLFVINVLLLLGREEGKTDIISTVVIGHDPLMELFMFGSYWYLEKEEGCMQSSILLLKPLHWKRNLASSISLSSEFVLLRY